MNRRHNEDVIYDRDGQIKPYIQAKQPGNYHLLESALNQLPLIVVRRNWNKYARELGLPYTAKTLANNDSKGTGPKCYRDGVLAEPTTEAQNIGTGV